MNDDFDPAADVEEEDELASAGLHVVGEGDADLDDLEDEAPVVLPDTPIEEEKPKTGLEELEELERSLEEEKEYPAETIEDDEDAY